MANVSPTISVIRAQVRAIRIKAPNARVFGISSPAPWTGPQLNGTGADQIAVFQCNSPLQMRVALQETPVTEGVTVLVTPLEVSQISDDIMMRLARRQLHQVNSWEIVRQLFKAKNLDPRVTQHAFLADLLLEYAEKNEVPPAAGGLLDAETVWGLLLEQRLGIRGSHLDLVELLRATAEGGLAERWRNGCSAEFRGAATTWLTRALGEIAETVLRCVQGPHGDKAVALGLVMGVVYHPAAGHELDKSAGRLEALVDAPSLPPETARRWSEAAAACLAHLEKSVQRRVLAEAEALLQQIGAGAFAWMSELLDCGFEQRLSRLATALMIPVAGVPGAALPDALLKNYEAVRRHRGADDRGRRLDRIEMAVRLVRWLADQGVMAGPPPTVSLLDAARWYACDGGFVDWARDVLRGGEPNPDMAAAWMQIIERVTKTREAWNREFARLLAERQAQGVPEAGLLPVEMILDRVVTRVAAEVPVLVLLMDAMSWAVYRELLEDMKTRGWSEWGLTPAASRLIGVAVAPSITETSRTSLLCGALRRGQAFDEASGFASHPGLLRVSQGGSAPKLFHKAALEGVEDTSLAGEVRQALADPHQRVVGIVINAIDDHLDKGDQLDVVWSVTGIRALEPILSEAAQAGRAVVLVSDHGHVVDRQTEGLEAGDGLRWRRPGAKLQSGEIEMASPRVLLPETGRVVMPWTEKLRYGQRKNGYHGGASLQEMLVPIGILWHGQQPISGLEETVTDTPAWWAEPAVTLTKPAVEVPKEREKTKKDKQSGTPALFELPPLTPAGKAPEAVPGWLKTLLTGTVFAAQKRLTGRVPVDDQTVQRLILALVSRGGTMTGPALATALAVPQNRLRGLLAGAQRLLNVEGYAVLSWQEAADTVVLNEQLLKKQFEVEK